MKNWLKLKIAEEDYKLLSKNIRDSMEILVIDTDEFDYSDDELLKELKKVSNKAYKAVKKREYELRHNK